MSLVEELHGLVAHMIAHNRNEDWIELHFADAMKLVAVARAAETLVQASEHKKDLEHELSVMKRVLDAAHVEGSLGAERVAFLYGVLTERHWQVGWIGSDEWYARCRREYDECFDLDNAMFKAGMLEIVRHDQRVAAKLSRQERQALGRE